MANAVVSPPSSPGEKWLPHPEYGSLILVSSLGRVFSRKSLAVRKASINSKGYYQLSINLPNKRVNKPVHLLVLETFKGERPIGAIARHLNDVKTDCREDNLEWATSQANIQDNLDNFKVRTQKITVEEVKDMRARSWSRQEVAAFCSQKGIKYQAYYKAKTGRSFRRV
jgi:hypothetical protein